MPVLLNRIECWTTVLTSSMNCHDLQKNWAYIENSVFSPIVYTLRKGTSTIGLDNTNKSSGLWVYLRLQRIHGDRASQWRRAWWWCRLKELSVENDANENFSSDPSPLASDCFIVSVLHDDGLIYVGFSNPWQVRGRNIEWSCLYQMKVRQLVGVVMVG